MINVSRRLLLKFIVVGGAVLAASWIGLRSNAFIRLRSATALKLRTDASGLLQSKELEVIAALAVTLIPKDETPGADGDWVRAYVNQRTTQEPGFLREYQDAASLLDRLALGFRPSASGFNDLTLDERDALLHAQFDRLGPWHRIRLLISGPATADVGVLKARCRRFVFEDLIDGFYRSSGGWAVVGYSHYRGTPGDPRAYTGPVAAHQSRLG